MAEDRTQLIKKRQRQHGKEDGSQRVQPEWLIQYLWLRTSDQGLFCNPCNLANKSLVKMSVVTLLHLKQHEQTRKHAEAMESYGGGEFREAAGETTQALVQAYDRPPQKTLPVFIEEKKDEALLKDFEGKRIQFLMVFDILKHHRPMRDYEWQQETLAAHPSFAELMPSKHKTDDAGWEIVEAIDEVLLVHMQRCPAEAEFIGISVDASCALFEPRSQSVVQLGIASLLRLHESIGRRLRCCQTRKTGFGGLI